MAGADPADAEVRSSEEETIEQLPSELKENDELLNAEVAKTIDGKMFKGVVEDIEVGQISRDRLYRVRYTDGDLEHMTETEVRQVLVALATKFENDEGQVMMKRPAARKQTLEVVAEEDVEMGAPEEDTTMKKPAGRAKGKAKAKAKAADPVVQEEEEEAQDMETTEAPAEEEPPEVEEDLEGVLVAFCAMEYRRLRRIRNGRIVKDGLGRHLNSAMKGIIVVLLLAEVFDITTQRFGIQQVWIIPAGLTLALVIPAAVQTLYYPEHTFTLWVSTELYAFCLWFAWWFDARDESNKDSWHSANMRPNRNMTVEILRVKQYKHSNSHILYSLVNKHRP
ncbi:unnamed protein product [Cladocopium goreaui]|uniref:Uncharacterized protein n=1 Tax=Cladocopium goreaui TaxID=2562237 RepID=A0A9P1GIR9_9DINO|nr:unnamed protein product [Cladocopium goreaui]